MNFPARFEMVLSVQRFEKIWEENVCDNVCVAWGMRALERYLQLRKGQGLFQGFFLSQFAGICWHLLAILIHPPSLSQNSEDTQTQTRQNWFRMRIFLWKHAMLGYASFWHTQQPSMLQVCRKKLSGRWRLDPVVQIFLQIWRCEICRVGICQNFNPRQPPHLHSCVLDPLSGSLRTCQVCENVVKRLLDLQWDVASPEEVTRGFSPWKNAGHWIHADAIWCLYIASTVDWCRCSNLLFIVMDVIAFTQVRDPLQSLLEEVTWIHCLDSILSSTLPVSGHVCSDKCLFFSTSSRRKNTSLCSVHKEFYVSLFSQLLSR